MFYVNINGKFFFHESGILVNISKQMLSQMRWSATYLLFDVNKLYCYENYFLDRNVRSSPSQPFYWDVTQRYHQKSQKRLQRRLRSCKPLSYGSSIIKIFYCKITTNIHILNILKWIVIQISMHTSCVEECSIK